jgi:hypothetical protein
MKPITFSFAACSLAIIGVATVSGTPTKKDTKAKKLVPTFARDVAPILYAKCAPCHHAGEVAPFNLTSYEDARGKAPTIAAVVKQKYMPPWQAVSHGEFSNERTLSAQEIDTLNDWAKAGAPKGDLARAPKAPVYTPGWSMGTPDFVGKPAHAFSVDAEGADEYRCFVVPTHFSEDKYITGVEVRPGNRRVVHHVLVYLDKSGTARKRDGEDGRLGYSSFGGPGFLPVGALGGWVPGLQYQSLPSGDGFLLPKDADIVLQVHYHKNGKPETDLSQIGLRFATAPIDKHVRWESVDNELISINPGESRHEVTADIDLPAPVTLLDVIPHMHLLGHDMTVTATLPNGTKRQLVKVEPYDFNWQTRYIYKDPVHLPKGTHVSLVAHYDNTSANPHNPNNPPKKVVFGEQTTNEMCFAFFTYTFDDEHITKGVMGRDDKGLMASHRDLSIGKIFDHFDKNKDGSLDQDELTDAIDFFQSATGNPGKKAQDPAKTAKFIIGMYGKAEKGKVSRAEFTKMASMMLK